MVLVTGGAGYIGSVVVDALLRAGEEAVVLDDLSTGHEDAVAQGLLIRGDIEDGALVESICRERAVDAVIHFAAKSLVGESMRDPLLYVRHNVGKTAALLQSMRRAGVRRLVFSSTAAVYGEPERTPIPEDHPKRPVNPYGLSKWWIEQTISWCRAAWGLDAICLRYFNAAGAVPERGLRERHDPETHLIPRLLAALSAGRPVEVFGTDYPTPDGSAVRDYIHVLDLAQAHLVALWAVREGRSGAYNVGTGEGHSVLEVVSRLEEVAGVAVARSLLPRRAGDPAALVADGARLRAELGWEPRHSDLHSIIASAREAAQAAGRESRGGAHVVEARRAPRP